MTSEIFSVSKLLRGRTNIKSVDYREILHSATDDSLIYMDPPYQGVCLPRDPRYINGVEHKEFFKEIKFLVDNNYQFIISYDGKKGTKTYGEGLPKELGLLHIEINAGRSSQSTLLGDSDITYESIYLSPRLISDIKTPINKLLGETMRIQET